MPRLNTLACDIFINSHSFFLWSIRAVVTVLGHSDIRLHNGSWEIVTHGTLVFSFSDLSWWIMGDNEEDNRHFFGGILDWKGRLASSMCKKKTGNINRRLNYLVKSQIQLDDPDNFYLSSVDPIHETSNASNVSHTPSTVETSASVREADPHFMTSAIRLRSGSPLATHDFSMLDELTILKDLHQNVKFMGALSAFTALAIVHMGISASLPWFGWDPLDDMNHAYSLLFGNIIKGIHVRDLVHGFVSWVQGVGRSGWSFTTHHRFSLTYSHMIALLGFNSC